MYFLIPLIGFYMPLDFSARAESASAGVFWHAQLQLPSLDDIKRRAEEAVKKPIDDILRKSMPADRADIVSSTPTPKSDSGNAVDSKGKMLVSTSEEILPIPLPTYKGLPVSRPYYATTRVAIDDPEALDQINMQRWFVLMNLRDTKWLENPASAMVLAAANLPSAKWPEYFNCGRRSPDCAADVKALNNRPGVGRNLPAWKGSNDAERAHSRKAFVDRYGKLLIGQGSALPQDLYVVTLAHLSVYSPQKGGLPISATGFLDGNKRADDPRRRLHLVGSYTAGVQNRLPEVLKCDPGKCEAILDAVPDRQKILKLRPVSQSYPVYLLVKARVSKLQASNGALTIGPGYHSGGGAESEATILGDIAVYADKELSVHLHDFKGIAR